VHEFEENAKQEKEYNEIYEKLYQQILVPQLAKLAQAKFSFVRQAHYLFEQRKFSKPKQKQFTELALQLLQDVPNFIAEAHELAAHFLNKQVQLLNKREKAAFNNMLAEEGFSNDAENFDAHHFQDREKMEEQFHRQHEEFFNEQKKTQQEQKKEAYKLEDINRLYKELARQLHPDLEQDENVRKEKEHLMKDLSKARQSRDLYAMLMIKNKTQQLFAQDNNTVKNAAYSLDQLKTYNKELKKKLEEHKAGFMMNFFNDMEFNSNGFVTGVGKPKDPQDAIDQEIKEIKKAIKQFETDIKNLKTPDDINELLEIYRTHDMSGNSDLPF
jgi:hypothetical protein